MKQGSRQAMMAKLLGAFGYEGVDHKFGTKSMAPNLGRQKNKRVRKLASNLYKSATSGFPRTSQPCGSIPAPTMDQVRRIERRIGRRLIVRLGLLHYKDTGDLYIAAPTAIPQMPRTSNET